jgi:RNA polymerase sigma-70 factor (ECF subfamily)
MEVFCRKCGKAVSVQPAPKATRAADGPDGASHNDSQNGSSQKESEEKARLRARTESLVKAAQAGDGDSFTQLYRLYYQKVYALARTTVKSDADAEDVLQVTFLKAWDNLEKLKKTGAFSTWIQRITLNQCYSLLRKKHADISIDDEDDNQEPIQLESDLMLPEVYAERSDLKTRLGKIIRELSAVQQQTITLYYYDGLPVENIAWIMDCGVNTVKSRLFLARKSIKTEIEEQERKSGQKFYGVTGIGLVPFGKLFLGQMEAASLSSTAAATLLKGIAAQIAGSEAKSVAGRSTAEKTAETVAKGAAKAGGNTTARAGAQTVAKTAGTASVKAGGGTAAKAVTAAVTKKVITGILAATLATGALTGGAVATVHAIHSRQEDREETDMVSIDSSDVFAEPNGMDPQEPSDASLIPGYPQIYLSKTEREAYEAYLELLKKEKVGIDNYIWQRGYTLFYDDDDEPIPLTDANRSRPVALCDVYGDDLPELIYVGDADKGQWNDQWGYSNDYEVNLHIVSYRDGRLITLYEDTWDGWGDSYNAYHLFQLRGSKDLYATSSNGDISEWDYVYRFTMGTDDRLHVHTVCYHYYEGEEDVLDDGEEKDSYYNEDRKITPEEYSNILCSLNDDTVTVLMYSYFHIDEFRSAVDRHGCIAMTCDDAIVYLSGLLNQDGLPEGQASEARLFNAYAAYREYLIPRMTGIENYVWQHGDWECFYDVDERTGRMIQLKEPWTDNARVIPRSVVLYDVYGDSVPELIYVGDVDSPNISSVSTLNVLTYEGGRIVSLYSGAWDKPEFEESVSAHSLLVRSDGTLIFYRGEGSTFDSLDHYEEFVLGEDGKLHREMALEHVYDEQGEGNDLPVIDTYYGRERVTISKEMYEAQLSQVVPRNSILLFDRYSYADFAMTAQEAVAYLADQLTASLPTIDYPNDLPTKFFFGSGVGAWGDYLEIRPDGTITGKSSDWDGGDSGPGYDSTYEYYAAYSCRFKDMKQINAYTYIFTVYDVASQFENGKVEIKDRIRYLYSDACPFHEDMKVTVYAKGTPVECIPKELWEMYEMAAAQQVYATMPSGILIYGSGSGGFFEG